MKIQQVSTFILRLSFIVYKPHQKTMYFISFNGLNLGYLKHYVCNRQRIFMTFLYILYASCKYILMKLELAKAEMLLLLVFAYFLKNMKSVVFSKTPPIFG